ncbi:MAG: hypothetical protein LIV28_09620 [Lactobacillus sp.]|nr:hypothetical protein [Lactobacillus sp.]
MKDPLIEMMKSNGVIYNGDRIELRDTLKRWIAIYFNGGQFRYNGDVLSDKKSEDAAFALIGLFDWFERNHHH